MSKKSIKMDKDFKMGFQKPNFKIPEKINVQIQIFGQHDGY